MQKPTHPLMFGDDYTGETIELTHRVGAYTAIQLVGPNEAKAVGVLFTTADGTTFRYWWRNYQKDHGNHFVKLVRHVYRGEPNTVQVSEESQELALPYTDTSLQDVPTVPRGSEVPHA